MVVRERHRRGRADGCNGNRAETDLRRAAREQRPACTEQRAEIEHARALVAQLPCERTAGAEAQPLGSTPRCSARSAYMNVICSLDGTAATVGQSASAGTTRPTPKRGFERLSRKFPPLSSFFPGAVIQRKASTVPASPRRLRVLVVDDDTNFTEMLAEQLGNDPRVTIVGRSADGAEAVELALRLRPDIVIMDVDMPMMDGINAARHIRSPLRRTVVVLVSGSDDAERRTTGVATFSRKSEADKLVDNLSNASAFA
jgi:CheY-like chemotaxis protein